MRDTREFTLHEIKTTQEQTKHTISSPRSGKEEEITNSTAKNSEHLNFVQVFAQTSWKNRSLFSVSQAGLVNNLIFGVSWGLFTLYFASYGLKVSDIGFLKALHPSIWGILQLATGLISDRIGRKALIYPGMFVQGIGIWLILLTNTFYGWIIGMSLLGIGTALVYPTLLAAISDIADPTWRATSLGVIGFGEI